jgi:anti-sigma factor ChrR (cupin superfamily)
MNPSEINCAEACVNGCVLGEECPNLQYQEQASKFIQETSLDDMLALAEAAARKKMMERPQWVLPDDDNNYSNPDEL